MDSSLIDGRTALTLITIILGFVFCLGILKNKFDSALETLKKLMVEFEQHYRSDDDRHRDVVGMIQEIKNDQREMAKTLSRIREEEMILRDSLSMSSRELQSLKRIQRAVLRDLTTHNAAMNRLIGELKLGVPVTELHSAEERTD